MNIKLQIPFVKNPGWECGQTCSAMMIKYFYPNRDMRIEEFDKIIHHKGGEKYTFPLQNAILLEEYGVKSKCYSYDDYKTTKEEPNIFEKWFGEDFEREAIFIDEKEYNCMVEEGRKRNLFQMRNTSLDDMVDMLSQGHLVAFACDWNTLVGRTGPYQGHFLLLSGAIDDTLLVHNPDEGPHIAYPRAQIEAAYKHHVIADDCWVGLGKK